MHGFAYVAPASRVEAIGLLREHGPGARLLAGGTDLIVGLRAGRLSARLVVDLKGVDDLRPAVEAFGDRVRIAATTPMSRVIRDEHVRRHFPALVEAASVVGSVQIRNRATLAGNICNASPAADTAPALLIYGAEVVIATDHGERRLPLDRFLVGPRQTALGPTELVSAIELPIPQPGSVAGFARLTRRRGVDLATISMGCSIDGSGRITFAYGAVAPVPFVVSDDSGILADPQADPAERDATLAALTAHARPISDVRASRAYRQAMLLVLSRRLVRSLVARRPGA